MPGSFPEYNTARCRLVDNELSQVRELIDAQISVCTGPAEPLLYLQDQISRGKMLRPGLVLLSYRVVRDASCEKKMRDGMRQAQADAIRIAAVMELIHNATLLHDDVIDEGQKRRGLATINSLWGNESAVLLGDILLSRVFQMCTDLEPQIIRIIAAATTRTCEGELKQITQKRSWHLSESEYIDTISEKSAAVFSACCHLGSLLAGADHAQIQSLADFGLNFGIAFQITDDLLDIVGDESKMGKTLGSDANKHKLTLAVIHLLTTVDKKKRSGVKARLDAAGESKEALVEMLTQYGSLDYARNRVQQFTAKAIDALAGLKHTAAKEALIETAKFVSDRASQDASA